MSAIVICLTCKKRLGIRRGCCDSCYARNLQRVNSGQTSWPELEAAGLALPAMTRAEKARIHGHIISGGKQ